MSTFSTHDLRSGAKPYQRDKNHHTKWARGVKICTRHDEPADNCPKCIGLPARRGAPKNLTKLRQSENHKLSNQTSTLARKAFRNEVVDAMDGPLANVSDASSGEEDVQDSSAARLPVEADFMYNYDTFSGPHAGQEVLSHAIAQAVRRFENNETEKLVNKEYDIVSDKDTVEDYPTHNEEHDFEMVEHSHLN